VEKEALAGACPVAPKLENEESVYVVPRSLNMRHIESVYLQ